MQSNNFSSSEGILKQNQLEALKSLSLLLVREINSLEETQATLEKEIEGEKPICLFEELQPSNRPRRSPEAILIRLRREQMYSLIWIYQTKRRIHLLTHPAERKSDLFRPTLRGEMRFVRRAAGILIWALSKTFAFPNATASRFAPN